MGHSFYGCCGARRRSMWEWRTDTYPGGPYGASNGYAGTNGCTHCNPGAYLHAGAHSPAAVPDATNPAYARRNQG